MPNIKERLNLNQKTEEELTLNEMIQKNLNDSKERVAEIVANDIIAKKTLPKLRKKYNIEDTNE